MSETLAGIEAVEAEPAALHPVHDFLVDCLTDSLGVQRFCSVWVFIDTRTHNDDTERRYIEYPHPTTDFISR